MSNEGKMDENEQRIRQLLQAPIADDPGFSVVDWWDVQIRANRWFEIGELSPEQAALLLFGHKAPEAGEEGDLDKALAKAKRLTLFDAERELPPVPDGKPRYGVNLSPRDFDSALAELKQLDKDNAIRGLHHWLMVAEAKNLPHHSWVRAYVNEMGWAEPAPPKLRKDRPKPRTIMLTDAQWEKMQKLGNEWLIRRIDRGRLPKA